VYNIKPKPTISKLHQLRTIIIYKQNGIRYIAFITASWKKLNLKAGCIAFQCRLW